MRVVGSVQEGCLWRKENGKQQVTCADWLVSTQYFFLLLLFTAWDSKEKIHAIQSPAQILLHQ